MNTRLAFYGTSVSIVLAIALGGCVTIHNTYTGIPTTDDARTAQHRDVAATTSDCGCARGPAYSYQYYPEGYRAPAGGTVYYPYPYYPQPYPYYNNGTHANNGQHGTAPEGAGGTGAANGGTVGARNTGAGRIDESGAAVGADVRRDAPTNGGSVEADPRRSAPHGGTDVTYDPTPVRSGLPAETRPVGTTGAGTGVKATERRNADVAVGSTGNRRRPVAGGADVATGADTTRVSSGVASRQRADVPATATPRDAGVVVKKAETSEDRRQGNAAGPAKAATAQPSGGAAVSKDLKPVDARERKQTELTTAPAEANERKQTPLTAPPAAAPAADEKQPATNTEAAGAVSRRAPADNNGVGAVSRRTDVGVRPN